MRVRYTTDNDKNVYNEHGEQLAMCNGCDAILVLGNACCGETEPCFRGSDWEPQPYLEYYNPAYRSDSLVETCYAPDILFEIDDVKPADLAEWVVVDLLDGDQWDAITFWECFKHLR